jgi:hypothetical protein
MELNLGGRVLVLDLGHQTNRLFVLGHLENLNSVIITFNVRAKRDSQILASVVRKAERVQRALTFIGEEGALCVFAGLVGGEGVVALCFHLGIGPVYHGITKWGVLLIGWNFMGCFFMESGSGCGFY